MPLDKQSYGHTYLTSYGWSGKGTGLRHGAIEKPLAIPPKKNLSGLGKDRDEAFPFWDHLFAAASKAITIKVSSDDEDDPQKVTAIDFNRTTTGIISNRRPVTGTPASVPVSGTATPDSDPPHATRLSLIGTARREAAKRGLYSRFFRGPVLGPDGELHTSTVLTSASSSPSPSPSRSPPPPELPYEPILTVEVPRKNKKKKGKVNDEERRERKKSKKERRREKAVEAVELADRPDKASAKTESAKEGRDERKRKKRPTSPEEAGKSTSTPPAKKRHKKDRETSFVSDETESTRTSRQNLEKVARRQGRTVMEERTLLANDPPSNEGRCPDTIPDTRTKGRQKKIPSP